MKYNQQGVGLVEVLVAVLLLSVAVLGFSALQIRAISATDESLIRTQALSIVRGLAENMRANATALDSYEESINGTSTVTDINKNSCKALIDVCTSKQLAVKEAIAAKAKLSEYGVSVRMNPCPGTADFSEIKCIVAAWGDTLPSMGTEANTCANENGIYKRGSTCIIVEAY